jgi:hypothetical protein
VWRTLQHSAWGTITETELLLVWRSACPTSPRSNCTKNHVAKPADSQRGKGEHDGSLRAVEAGRWHENETSWCRYSNCTEIREAVYNTYRPATGFRCVQGLYRPYPPQSVLCSFHCCFQAVVSFGLPRVASELETDEESQKLKLTAMWKQPRDDGWRCI